MALAPSFAGPSGLGYSAIVGGVIGGVALLAAIGAGILALLRLRRRSVDTAGGRGTMDGRPNSFMGMGENRAAPNHGGDSSPRYEMDSVPVPQLVHGPDNTGV
ncbi:hypothetical protein HOY82DRAFT_598044 [Tuber indicum]|nr:hypothetical protein HOY82DRAFT_598044 [Tuber indicum]